MFSLTYFWSKCKIMTMKSAKSDTVSFSVKGQLVIPQWLRKQFDITDGTRAMVYPEGDHIVVKPMTARHYRKLRGSLKGTNAMNVLMSERKREREK